MARTPSHDDPLVVGVATPERVGLSLPVAGIGSRTAAYGVDAALLLFFWISVYFVFSLAADVLDAVRGLSGLMQTLLVLTLFASHWGYWTVCEVLWNGQSPGKRFVGIRVVRDDGSPVGFFESAVRNLLRVVDFLPALYGVGIVTMLSTRDGRRLGDLAAGTLLIREERFDLDRYTTRPESSAGTGAAANAVTLSTADTELILAFLERAPGLEPAARSRLAESLVRRFSAPGTIPDASDHEAYLRSIIHRADG